MTAPGRARWAALIAVAASCSLGGCDHRIVFYLNVMLLPGTTSLHVDSFVDGAMTPADKFDVALQADGGLTKEVGFEVSSSVKSLTVQLTAFDAEHCSVAATWSGLHSGQLDRAVVAFSGSFSCAPDGVDAGGDGGVDEGNDQGNDGGSDALPDASADGDAMVSTDVRQDADAASDDRSICPAPADPDAGVDASGDAGIDLCASYCQQIFTVCPAQASTFFTSVPDCSIKCVKIAWPVESHPPALSGNTISCRLHFLATGQCDEVTPLGGACGSNCDNYRQIMAQTCGVADAACNPTTIQTVCVRTAIEAARDPAWCAQATNSPGCPGCAP